MKVEQALDKIKYGIITFSKAGNMFKVFRNKYGIGYNEKKQKYIIFEPYIGNQRLSSFFQREDELTRYIEEKYHKKQ